MPSRALDHRYPCVDDMERAAARRIPHFAFEFLSGGIGREAALRRNRALLDDITFRPHYLIDEPLGRIRLETEILGRTYARPFGIAPLGLSGLMWPGTAEILARTAAKANIPVTLSQFATSPMSTIRRIAGENTWFQLYTPNTPEILSAMLDEIEQAGYGTLVVTVDIPTETRRERDLRAGLSVPPRFDLKTLLDVARCPTWALATLAHGIPRFKNVLPHIPKGLGVQEAARRMTDLIEGHVTKRDLEVIRARWTGKLVVKGVLSIADAIAVRDLGADAVWISNHGGRQLDAARSPVEILPEIRAALGSGFPLFADSGPRTGLDIARLMALGADFVFLGRAFAYGVAAIGAAGGDHVVHVLTEELSFNLRQIGCSDPRELGRFLG